MVTKKTKDIPKRATRGRLTVVQKQKAPDVSFCLSFSFVFFLIQKKTFDTFQIVFSTINL